MQEQKNIKSSAFTLRFANSGKRQVISDFLAEYKITLNKFIEYFWNNSWDPDFIPSSIYNLIPSRLKAKARQCCAAQANSVVKGTKAKQQRRIYKFNQLMKDQKSEAAAKLWKKIEKSRMTLPYVEDVKAELTSSMVEIAFSDETSFDGWINVGSLCLDKAKGRTRIPLKKHKHFNDLAGKGKVLKSILLSKNSIDIRIELPLIQKKTEGSTIGLDIGYLDVFQTSDGQSPLQDIHGWTLPLIIKEMCRKKPGSKGFRRADQHRKNYINMVLNQLDLSNVQILKLENIRDLRKGRKSSAALRHWTYTDIAKKLSDLCKQLGVSIEYIDPAFTSQRCNVCSWVKKTNRKGKLFKCKSCGHTQDSDLNAAINISLDLEILPSRKELDNRRGFYWKVRQEPIVPDAQKEKCLHIS